MAAYDGESAIASCLVSMCFCVRVGYRWARLHAATRQGGRFVTFEKCMHMIRAIQTDRDIFHEPHELVFRASMPRPAILWPVLCAIFSTGDIATRSAFSVLAE